MGGQEYVDSLKIQLDRIKDQNEIQRLITLAVKDLCDQGYSDEEIKMFFLENIFGMHKIVRI